MSARHVKSTDEIQEKMPFSAVLYEYAEAALYAMVLLVLLFTFLFRVSGVEGGSMEPTLQEGERLLLSMHFYEPDYDDIVVIDRYTQEPIIKRVIALEGDRIRIDEATGVVYRNDVPLDEAYVTEMTAPKDIVGEVTVPAGHIFVMGDHRSVSKDSRSQEIGMVDVEDVVGKAIVRIWPLDKFGIVDF